MQFGMMDYSFGAMGIGMLILGLVFWILVIVGACVAHKISLGGERKDKRNQLLKS